MKMYSPLIFVIASYLELQNEPNLNSARYSISELLNVFEVSAQRKHILYNSASGSYGRQAGQLSDKTGFNI